MVEPFSSSQLRAARALLNISRAELAEQTGVSEPTIHRLENDIGESEMRTQIKIRQVMEARGVEFIANKGVQWAQHQTRTLVGVEGFKTFYDDVRYVIREFNDEVVICGTDEKYLEQKLGKYIDHHRKEVASYGNVKMRCLIEENDFNLGASSYCHYRWQAKQFYSSVLFYIYGDKTAIIVPYGSEDPLIMVIHNRTITEAYRHQFEAMWSLAKEIPEQRKR